MHLSRPSQPRVLPVPRVYERLTKEGHGAPNLYATLAVNRRASNAMAQVLTYLFYDETPIVEARIRELVILRLAWNTQTDYHFGAHMAIARSSGMSDHEIFLTTRPLTEGNWAPQDLAVLKMTDDLFIDDCVTDTTWRDLAEHFSHEDIIALMVLSGAYRMHAGVLNSCGVQRDDGIPGWSAVSGKS
jgi:4-carboxymuconolactone decarboxylase